MTKSIFFFFITQRVSKIVYDRRNKKLLTNTFFSSYVLLLLKYFEFFRNVYKFEVFNIFLKNTNIFIFQKELSLTILNKFSISCSTSNTKISKIVVRLVLRLVLSV